MSYICSTGGGNYLRLKKPKDIIHITQAPPHYPGLSKGGKIECTVNIEISEKVKYLQDQKIIEGPYDKTKTKKEYQKARSSGTYGGD